MLNQELRNKGLSMREAEVAEAICLGLRNKEIAIKLFVTEKTVKFHLTNIYKKMGIVCRSQLVVWAVPYLTVEMAKAFGPKVVPIPESQRLPLGKS